MRLIQSVHRHPLATLALFAGAFGIWLWRDSIPVAAPPPAPVPVGAPIATTNIELAPGVFVEVGEDGVTPLRRPTPRKPGDTNAKTERRDTAANLAKLKPGMTRAEVEGLVGIPAPEDVQPATVRDGKVTYQTAYEANLSPTPTDTSSPQTTGGIPSPKCRTVVTLEFDATKPGHPLLAVHSTEPLH